MFQKYTRGGSSSPDAAPARPSIGGDSPPLPALDAASQAQVGTSTRHTALKVYLHEKLLSLLNLSVLDKITREELRKELAPLIRTKRPAVVVQVSPSTGEVGAVPCGMRSEETPVVLAGVIKAVVLDRN